MLKVTNKTNKPPSLINRCYHQFFSFANYSQNEKEGKYFFKKISFSEKELIFFFATFGLSF
jgi:hypothetical protein